MKRMLLSALLGMVLACIMPAALASGINNYFIIPDSDTRLLTEEELWGWQYEAVGYIYNEIFARHGPALSRRGKVRRVLPQPGVVPGQQPVSLRPAQQR